MINVEAIKVKDREKDNHTRYSVVQDEPKESSDEHVCCEEYNNHLVQLFYSFKRRRQHTCLCRSVSISRKAEKTFASYCHNTSVGTRKRNNLNQQQKSQTVKLASVSLE